MTRRGVVLLTAIACLAAALIALLRLHTARAPERHGEGGPSSVAAGDLLLPGEVYVGSGSGEAAAARFQIELRRGFALRGRIEQDGLDVVATLRDPDGATVLEMDSPTGDEGPELLCYVAGDDGPHTLEVSAWPGSPGRYELHLDRIELATVDDQSCWKGLRLFVATEAFRHQHGASPELSARYAEAATAFRDAELPYSEGLAWRQLAGISQAIGDAGEEEEALDRALDAFRRAGDVRQQVIVLSRIGRARQRRGEPAAAEAVLQEALDLALQHQDRFAETLARNDIALLWMARGEGHRAVEELERVLALWRSQGREAEVGEALHNLGAAYAEELDKFPEALDLLGEALDHWQRPDQVGRRISTLILIGWARYRSGDTEEAVKVYRQALALSRADGDTTATAAALDRMATALVKLGRTQKAFAAYEESLNLSRKTGNLHNEAHTRANLGWLYLESGRPAQARGQLKAALELLEPQGDRDAVAHALVGLARTERAAGDGAAARRHFEQALDHIEELRREALRQGARLPPDPLWQQYYEAYVDLLMDPAVGRQDREAPQRAFAVAELVHARNLAEVLREADVDLRADADPALLAEEANLIARSEALDRRLQGASRRAEAAGERLDLEREQRTLALHLERLRAEIRASSPRFDEIWNPHPPSLDEIQRLLPEDTALVSFALGERRSFLFVVGRHRFDHVVLPPRQPLELLARQVYRDLSLPAAAGAKADPSRDRLSRALFPSSLRLPEVHRLLVVADGALRELPFAALPLPGEPGEELIDAYEVLQLPTADLLPSLRRRQRRVPRAHRFELAVVGDPVFSPRDPRLTGLVRPDLARQAGEALSLLPHAGREAAALLALVPADRRLAALGFAANRERVRGGALHDARILHFATHAIIDEERPGRSRLVLSHFDPHGLPIPGDLDLNEIFTLDLPADLVVLSACRTALGQPGRGDGLAGLTHGFFFAGAGALVASLWDVGDEATADLMIELYGAMLRDGLPAAAALRRAQLHLRADPRWSDAHHWAAFIVEGP